MSNGDPQSTLREWRDHLLQPATLVTLAGVAAVLAIAGAFGTAEVLRPLARFLYWFGVSVATYCVGYLVSAVIHHRLGGRIHRFGLVGLTAFATGIGVALTVIAVNRMVFDWVPRGGEGMAFFATVFAVSAIVSLLFDMLSRRIAAHPDAGAPAPAPAAPPPILARMPVQKRARLVALSVEDHYVRVQTEMGEESVLMRLADAMREVGETAGLQVHRSHWVATSAVAAARREGDRVILTMTTGAEIPVSRRHLPAIREAGLLPRRADG